jgi:hypothetical protein
MLSYSPRTWGKIAGLYADNPFTFFDRWLVDLSIATAEALAYFTLDYNLAVTLYDDTDIQMIFKQVAAENYKKYDKMIAIYKATYNPLSNYDMTESSIDTRTPELSSTSSSSNTASSESIVNQTKTVTETPDNYSETSTRSVNTDQADGLQLRTESQNVNEMSGSRTQTEAYSGDPNTTTTTGTATTTTTTTGTDTNQHYATRSGNIGVTTSQQMAMSELEIAAKMTIFDTIKKDIAAKLFLGTWI